MGPRRSADAGVREPPAKRRATAARSAYPRRRAVTACQLCRMRKSKCDNRRPSCGTCSALQFQCVYQDTSTDYSSFDPASLAILDRVNHAIRLIEQRSNSPSTPFSDSPRTRVVTQEHPIANEALNLESTKSPEETVPNNTEYTFVLEAQQLQAQSASSNVLQWPLLRDICGPSEVDKLFFNPVPSDETTERPWSSSGRGIREEDVSALIESFLENVHTKNPILDPSELRNLSRCVGENGFQWDAQSCLVLITCALGTVSRPLSHKVLGSPNRAPKDEYDCAAAEAYYTAARKRIGLLDSSLIAVQCAFLIGVYEMYTMRPLRASLSFNRACIFFQTYLHSSSFTQPIEQSSESVRSRLYWSCLKSDCEMREEIALPPTELAKVKYSDAFPTPPGSGSIAGRRIANRVISTLYSSASSPENWTGMSIHHLERLVKELDTQVVQWAENFPPIFQAKENHADESPITNELSFYLSARYLDIRERIWRPFLYLATHSSPSDPNLPLYIHHANTALNLISKHIKNTTTRIHHRHHGSWFAGRNLFTKGLLLLVATRCENMVLPANWRELLEGCIEGLRFWEAEARDLGVARGVLELGYRGLGDDNEEGEEGVVE
ncbi:uncharacterized protein BDV14DRAFT_211388 [Aspergillus stella-maris]|uniref:uncharacterized protein n=1 Tax=Aspergillus stella-maris TaxID=1810926 RepID=UPI003CCCC3E0